MLEWTDAEARAAVGEPCELCWLGRRHGAVNPAVALAVVVGYCSDGGGRVHLEPVCAKHAKQRNVILCQGSKR